MSDAKFANFGCRLNSYEGHAMAELAKQAGVKDTIVINTCAVTAQAVRKAKQNIRKLARDNPDTKLIVTGCAAQIEPDSFASMPQVNKVIGNAEKMKPTTWAALSDKTLPKIAVDDIMSFRQSAGHLIDGFANRSRAYVQVQNGCDHRCTFCIIPYGRGNSRSVPADIVIEQIKRLVDRGFNEIVLTGVDMTSWGADLPDTPTLGNLVQRILRLVPDLARLRISSIDSIEADAALIETAKAEPRFMPHLHLSLQCGDDMILKRMKRRHRRDDAIRFCTDLRKARPDIVFGADIIAGFPTESDAMFENSLRLLAECHLTWLHVFPYSPRKGTPAARMPQVSGAIIKERAAQLRSAGLRRAERYLRSQHNRLHNILVETPFTGRTETFAQVRFAQPQTKGAIVRNRISGDNGKQLLVT